MNPDINAWAQTAEAQPYLQKYGISQQQMQPQTGGYGGYGGGQDNYTGYLQNMIQNNSQNPEFQMQLYSMLLNQMDPQTQLQTQQGYQQLGGYEQELGLQERGQDMDIIKALLASGSPEGIELGNNLLMGMFPDSGMNTTPEITETPYDLARGNAKNLYGETTDLEQLKWLNYQSQMKDQQFDAYSEPVTYMERNRDFRGAGENPFGRGLANSLLLGIPGFLDMLGGDDIRKTKAGYGN